MLWRELGVSRKWTLGSRLCPRRKALRAFKRLPNASVRCQLSELTGMGLLCLQDGEANVTAHEALLVVEIRRWYSMSYCETPSQDAHPSTASISGFLFVALQGEIRLWHAWVSIFSRGLRKHPSCRSDMYCCRRCSDIWHDMRKDCQKSRADINTLHLEILS